MYMSTTRVEATAGADAQIEPGDDLTIFGLAEFKRPVIEGRATAVARHPSIANAWVVQFKGEKCLKLRCVIPEAQGDPDRFLSALVAGWRSTIGREVVAGFLRPCLLSEI